MTLACDQLDLARGAATVLHGVTTALSAGEITAICGPNGAGKSSLLLTMAGLLDPLSGEVSLDGEPVQRMSARTRAQRIGFLPQEPQVAWDVAVENIVRLGRLPHRDRGGEAVERAIAALDLDALRHRPVSRLSGGEKARALLARVLAGEPGWLLADEPLAALDIAHQLRLLRQFRETAGHGTGVVLVLHDLASAMNHADRVLVMQKGRLIADGPPETALAPEVLAEVWGVTARWLGEPGARALASG